MEKETNKFHALQLFTDTFAAETVHLTNEQVGIYIRLLCFAWTKNTKPFKSEDAFIICQCKDDKCKSKVEKILNEFFLLSENNNTWTHKRLVQEHSYLVDKYKKRSIAGKKGAQSRYWNGTSSNANGKLIAPIPSPSPKPNKYIYGESFERLWDKLDIRRGAKYNAHKEFVKIEGDVGITIESLAETYNRQMKDVDAKFVPHFSTWLHQRRWEIDEKDERRSDSATIIDKMTKLGYVFTHSEDNFNYFKKHNKQYKIDRYDKEHMILDA